MANDKFERLEFKYLIDRIQLKELLKRFPDTVNVDSYGETEIYNIYFDTDDFLLIRSSIDKPVYKEKLRIRSYGPAKNDDTVYVELKKKYKGVVYKRRVDVTQLEAFNVLMTNKRICESQIGKEIEYFTTFYKSLRPRVFIGYNRLAYYDKEDPQFRVTFDTNINYRLDDLTLDCENSGTPLLDKNHVLMEIKIMGSFPLWLAHALSELQISKASFSKYGNAYKQCLKTGVIKLETKTNEKTEGVINYA